MFDLYTNRWLVFANDSRPYTSPSRDILKLFDDRLIANGLDQDWEAIRHEVWSELFILAGELLSPRGD